MDDASGCGGRRLTGSGGRRVRSAGYASPVVSWLTVVVIATVAVLGLAAGFYTWRNLLIDDRILLVAAILDVALIAQAVVAAVHLGDLASTAGRATFLAYALTLPAIPPFVVYLAIKEKTRWAMGIIAAGAFTVAVMTGRLVQMWSMHA